MVITRPLRENETPVTESCFDNEASPAKQKSKRDLRQASLFEKRCTYNQARWRALQKLANCKPPTSSQDDRRYTKQPRPRPSLIRIDCLIQLTELSRGLHNTYGIIFTKAQSQFVAKKKCLRATTHNTMTIFSHITFWIAAIVASSICSYCLGYINANPMQMEKKQKGEERVTKTSTIPAAADISNIDFLIPRARMFFFLLRNRLTLLQTR